MVAYLDKLASLTPLAKRVICDKATEHPHSGAYNHLVERGTYLCRRCGLALFRAPYQFHTSCGWPSFDCSLQAVKQQPDADGFRTEILCQRCESHLGHIFRGEYLTSKNTRYCVNSASLDWVLNDTVTDSEEAIVAGGCFWGVDYFLRRLLGVLQVEVGYCGGFITEPSYEQVCQGDTGHYEAVRVIFDPSKTTYSAIIQHFFEIHDPTQEMRQGPDRGAQYQSALFYFNQEQKKTAENLINQLKSKGYAVATRLLEVQTFWPAEAYHQNYYIKNKKQPYCHQFEPRFE